MTTAQWRLPLLLIALLPLLAVVGAVPAAATAPVGGAFPIPTPEEQALATTLHAVRDDVGLRPLTMDPTVTLLAEWRSADMALRHSFSHVTADGRMVSNLLSTSGVAYHTVGETIAMNAYAPDTVATAMRDLLNSPRHRAILLDPQYTTVGVGHAVDANGTHYFTVIVLA